MIRQSIAGWDSALAYPYHLIPYGNFRIEGDFDGAPGRGPIPEKQLAFAEMLSASHYRAALITDLYRILKPSKDFWSGSYQWTFLRGHGLNPVRA